MHHISEAMQSCIEECLACYRVCLGTAMTHCLEHVEPKHFRLMQTCAEVCRTAAYVMLLNSPHHKHICAECAEICQECAADCERLGDMQDCVTACRRCADSCRKMAA